MTIGIAMLARNSANDLHRALYPFLGEVDEIAILLGGKSTDNTPARAWRFTDKVADYTGPLDPDGGLLDFGLARQQSFDLLTTDWALLVDTDDVWSGVDKLGKVVSDAETDGYQGVLFPYDLGASKFLQTRLFRRTSGRWSSPVHELWTYDEAPNVKTLCVNALTIRQEKDAEGRNAGVWRNIAIAEAYLQDRFDLRLLMHLSREYIMTAQYDKALAAARRILDNLNEAAPADITYDKLFQVHYTRGIAHICLEEYEQAAAAAMAALSFAKYGHGWTLLAEVAYQTGVYELTLCAADKALQMGRPIDTIPAPWANVSSVPYHLKAKALKALGRKNEALVALDLGLGLGGGEDMRQFKFELCEELGVIP